MWYLAWNLGCGFAQNKGQLIAFRFLAGLGGSAPLSIGGGVLGDCWRAEQRGQVSTSRMQMLHANLTPFRLLGYRYLFARTAAWPSCRTDMWCLDRREDNLEMGVLEYDDRRWDHSVFWLLPPR